MAQETRVVAAVWTEEDDELLKESVRQDLPRIGNLTLVAAGLQRRLRRPAKQIFDRIQTLRRWDPQFDRFISQNIRTLGSALSNHGYGANGQGRGPRRRERGRAMASAPMAPRTDEALLLVKWASRHLGDLHPEQTEKLRSLVQTYGAVAVALALAESAMDGTRHILNHARAILQGDETAEPVDA